MTDEWDEHNIKLRFKEPVHLKWIMLVSMFSTTNTTIIFTNKHAFQSQVYNCTLSDLIHITHNAGTTTALWPRPFANHFFVYHNIFPVFYMFWQDIPYFCTLVRKWVYSESGGVNFRLYLFNPSTCFIRGFREHEELVHIWWDYQATLGRKMCRHWLRQQFIAYPRLVHCLSQSWHYHHRGSVAFTWVISRDAFKMAIHKTVPNIIILYHFHISPR